MILIERITDGNLIVCKTGFTFEDFLGFNYTVKDGDDPAVFIDLMMEIPAKNDNLTSKFKYICTKESKGRYPKHRVVIAPKDRSFEIVCFITSVFNGDVQRVKIHEFLLNKVHHFFGTHYAGVLTPLTIFTLSGKYNEERRKKIRY